MIASWNQLTFLSRIQVLFLVVVGCLALYRMIQFAMDRFKMSQPTDQALLREWKRGAESLEYFSMVTVFVTMLYLLRSLAGALGGVYLGDSRLPGYVHITMSIVQFLHVASVGFVMGLIIYSFSWMIRSDIRRIAPDGN